MKPFTVTVRTAQGCDSYTEIASTSFDAWEIAAAAQGETPCAITVLPARGAQ